MAVRGTTVGTESAETLSGTEARERLGLEAGEFRSALELGEIRADEERGRRIPVSEVHRLRGEPGFPDGLRARIADVGSYEAAGLLGVTVYRFGRLARAGYLRPVRWYVNRYRTVVWRYLVTELAAFAAGEQPGARMPDPGADRRARGWRARRVEQLLRDALDPWRRAAVWAALAGGRGAEAASELTADEAAYLRRMLPSLHSGGAGWRAAPDVITSLCTAQDPDEAEDARRQLAAALGRARTVAGPAPLLVPAREAAHALGCPASALPRAYTGALVPQDVLDRWRLAPPPWLRSARARTAAGATT